MDESDKNYKHYGYDEFINYNKYNDDIKNKYFLAAYLLYKQFGGAKKKWTTLEHNGVLFPPEYEPHRVPVIYQGREIVLDEKSEEIATLYAKYIETDYVKNKTFNKNFWNDWKKYLGDDHEIKSLEDCDFSLIYQHILDEKERKKVTSHEEKEKRKQEEEKYKYAIVDGKKQKVGNFRVEPIGLFIGRGCNPKLGRVKRRIYPEDVTINIGREAPIPETLPGHTWGEIIHDQYVEWLASWKDDITNKLKYVWLSSQSEFKAESDIKKFELARKLKKKIRLIREENTKNLTSDDIFTRQIATALYFIDNLALRVGNEKGEDAADTVGVTTLKIENVKLLEDDRVLLSFLGKDSVPYKNVVKVDPIVYNNIEEFSRNKNLDDKLFDKINSNDVNKYLQTFMKNLSAKVFRTYRASQTFQKELQKISKKYDTYEGDDKISILLDEFNKANATVAILCNHQKNISKSFSEQIEKINRQIKRLREQLRKAKSPEKKRKIKKKIKSMKVKKQLKLQLKNISLGTSKVNYIDPRITVAFMKRHNIPIDKLFPKTLQEKFSWAMDTPEDYVF